GRTDQATLSGRLDSCQPPPRAEGEVDELDVVNGDVGAGIAAGDPLRELTAADLLGLEQGTVAIVDVLQHTLDNVRPQLLVVGVGELVINDARQHALLPGQGDQLVQLLEAEDGGLLDQDVLAGGEG